jgi:hypothetical protein
MAEKNRKADNEEVRANEESTDERPARDRSYMKTWGSTVQYKQAFADKAAEEAEDSDPVKVEAERPGVNPVVAPNVDAEGHPVNE